MAQEGIKGQKMATMAIKGIHRREWLLRQHVVFNVSRSIALYSPLSALTNFSQICDLVEKFSVPHFRQKVWGSQFFINPL
ncbi:hypothetical protein AMJ83_10680 [candidate division WOR_3 bacterium SM23_42]|uniref:Uncharacterized protein n=1 Tax=candidate division WOR_3 bacterium SM23_42 TaxID=1703779 RepID=A0A0S8FSX0_UNCW3|nr:MAG: hypothetical protein AMJ83_10680 [candidate division WOR_3 bacterium SM23_42]